MKGARGFTLIELIVVIVILGILAATALPKFIDLGSDARMAVMHGVEGSMRSANAMVYAKAALAGKTTVDGTGASDYVTIGTTNVTVKYGYAKDAAQLAGAMEIDANKVVLNGTTDLYYTGKSSCKVVYTAPAASGGSPTYDSSGVTATNC